MESVIPCEPNGSRDPRTLTPVLSSTELQQAVAYRDFCYTAPNLRNGDALVDDVWFESAQYPARGGQLSASRHR